MVNAWIQRLIVFSSLLLGLFWACTSLKPVNSWALTLCFGVLVGLLSLASVNALALAAEFSLQSWINKGDPSPRAKSPDRIKALWNEWYVLHLVFFWRQPFRHRAQSDMVKPNNLRGVVLVHGFFCNRAIWADWLAALHKFKHVAIAVDLSPAFGSIDDMTGAIDDAVKKVAAFTGCAPIIVGHSMGGLAARAWRVAYDTAEHLADSPNALRPSRVHQTVTIGTPHHGTWLARFSMSENGRQMRLGSPWLRHLETREAEQKIPINRDNFVCFYSNCDNIVMPASSATLQGADNRHHAGKGHVDLLFSASVMKEVFEMLQPVNESATLKEQYAHHSSH